MKHAKLYSALSYRFELHEHAASPSLHLEVLIYFGAKPLNVHSHSADIHYSKIQNVLATTKDSRVPAPKIGSNLSIDAILDRDKSRSIQCSIYCETV